MHTDPAFADTLASFGECARVAADIVKGISDRDEQIRTATSIQQAMTRFFWFTIEFGLMKGLTASECKVYGSGLLSNVARGDTEFTEEDFLSFLEAGH